MIMRNNLLTWSTNTIPTHYRFEETGNTTNKRLTCFFQTELDWPNTIQYRVTHVIWDNLCLVANVIFIRFPSPPFPLKHVLYKIHFAIHTSEGNRKQHIYLQFSISIYFGHVTCASEIVSMHCSLLLLVPNPDGLNYFLTPFFLHGNERWFFSSIPYSIMHKQACKRSITFPPIFWTFFISKWCYLHFGSARVGVGPNNFPV